MEKSKVYYTDFHTVAFGDGRPVKLEKLIKKAGIGDMDLDGKFVAIKMHFGEYGNVSFLRPNYARAVVDVVKELGGKPFLTDCNTMYPGSRKNALEHLDCAWLNGFTPYTVGCPVIIADGLKGTDDIAVPVNGGEYLTEARIGHAIMDADVFISLTHFKGHEMTGFGGTMTRARTIAVIFFIFRTSQSFFPGFAARCINSYNIVPQNIHCAYFFCLPKKISVIDCLRSRW